MNPPMSRAPVSCLLPLAAVVALSGCNEPREEPIDRQAAASRRATAEGETPMSITIHSDAFGHNERIPTRFTEDGEDVSPPLSWSNLPPGTKELTLIVDDPDAPRKDPWVHWVIYRIPAGATHVAEGIASSDRLSAPAGAVQGANSWGTIGYRGPAPPRGHGIHHYRFTLYALNAEVSAEPGLDKQELLAAIKGHVLAQGQLVGTYER
jgi:Raf kinase inhibitor-like YbhB/YbcL family protein